MEPGALCLHRPRPGISRHAPMAVSHRRRRRLSTEPSHRFLCRHPADLRQREPGFCAVALWDPFEILIDRQAAGSAPGRRPDHGQRPAFPGYTASRTRWPLITMSGQKTILVAEDDSNDVVLLERAFVKAHLDVHFEFVQDGEQLIH